MQYGIIFQVCNSVRRSTMKQKIHSEICNKWIDKWWKQGSYPTLKHNCIHLQLVWNAKCSMNYCLLMTYFCMTYASACWVLEAVCCTLSWARGILLEPSSSMQKTCHIQLYTIHFNNHLSLLDCNSCHKSPSTEKTNKSTYLPLRYVHKNYVYMQYDSWTTSNEKTKWCIKHQTTMELQYSQHQNTSKHAKTTTTGHSYHWNNKQCQTTFESQMRNAEPQTGTQPPQWSSTTTNSSGPEITMPLLKAWTSR